MAKIGQTAENTWVGVNCGIMDQMISAAGRADHALLIDCRSLQCEAQPLPSDTAVVVMNTATRRGLVDSAYNERRGQCAEATRFFGVSVLRDVDLGGFESQNTQMDELPRRRACHVITENDRVMRAAAAMKANDPVTLGRLMQASRVSLRDDFEASSNELNAILECAQHYPACYGARMTGAGLGGCAVALIQAEAGDTFLDMIAACYTQKTGRTPNIYVCTATHGAEVISDSAGGEKR